MKYTFDENIFSDLYKDAYGVRPRGHAFYTASNEEKQKIWDDTLQAQIDNEKFERAVEKECINKFEKTVDHLIQIGANERSTAIRWMMDASDAAGDWDYFSYQNNLPYNYLKEAS